MRTNNNVVSQIHIGYDQPNLRETKVEDNNKHERRVRFPDDDVISEYLEPFRPVSDNCTSEELIAAYLESCFRNKVAPIEFLLEQLKGIDLSICNERYSRLSLKGIHLNRLQVETLEEIFRRVHFRELDFENTYLDDPSAVALFDMLLFYETCNELHITMSLDRPPSGQAWGRCVTFVRRSKELRRFALSHTPLSITNFLGLSFFGLSLEYLSLRDCNMSGQPLFGLVRWLRLLLSSSSLDPPRREKSNSSTLQSQKRSGSSENDLGARPNEYCPPFPAGPGEPAVWELKLDLSSNRLNSVDAETLLALVRHQLLVPQVQALYQPDAADQSPSGESRLAGAANEDSCVYTKPLLPIGGIGYLAELNLSDNSIGDEGLRIISTALLQCYRMRLRRLHSVSTAVTGQEATDDCSVTCSSSNRNLMTESDPEQFTSSQPRVSVTVRGLRRLCLANNGLTNAGMQSLALVLMQTPMSLVPLVGGLVSLDLSSNPGIRDEGIEILCEGLMRNHSLKELYLRSMRMGFQGIFALSSFLTESKCLQLLDIRSNPIDLASLMALSKTLSLNKTLTSLFSDARSLTASDSPLIATDAELIISLIDEIDSYLRRNRSLASATNTSTADESPEVPSSTSVNTVESDNSEECCSSEQSEEKTICSSEMAPKGESEPAQLVPPVNPGEMQHNVILVPTPEDPSLWDSQSAGAFLGDSSDTTLADASTTTVVAASLLTDDSLRGNINSGQSFDQQTPVSSVLGNVYVPHPLSSSPTGSIPQSTCSNNTLDYQDLHEVDLSPSEIQADGPLSEESHAKIPDGPLTFTVDADLVPVETDDTLFKSGGLQEENSPSGFSSTPKLNSEDSSVPVIAPKKPVINPSSGERGAPAARRNRRNRIKTKLRPD
ncbi:unnamed protein product [Calicophoron daubneyi]|uniref:Leucine-rich repeat-containing protein 68 n=1 Tax=Calicophoron daubneyi TaxID=300641 RepID=A0AAV2TGC2_CALDB